MVICHTPMFENVENLFTELFISLKCRGVLPKETIVADDPQGLATLHQRIDDASDFLLETLQEINCIVLLCRKKIEPECFKNIDFFIFTMGNLTEALTILRLDADYVSKIKEINDFM